MSLPTTTHGDATTSVAAAGAPETGGSNTPYTDFMYNQILQGHQYPSPDRDDDEEEEVDTEEDDADTVWQVDEDDEDDDDGDDETDDDEDFPRVDYQELAAQVSDPTRRALVQNWRQDLAVKPASYVGDWLRAYGKSALFGISDAQFEAFVGFPQEFIAVRTKLNIGNCELYTIRDCGRYVRLIKGLWKVKTQPVEVMQRRKEAMSGSRREVQRAARDRRRELLATGQSYWTDPTPLRVLSLPGEEAEEELDEDALMAEFLELYGDESRCVGALDGQLTVDGGVADAMVDPMLFDPRVLEGTAADEHAELPVAEEEASALGVGADLSPDVTTEGVGVASGAVASTEVEVDGGDSVAVGVVGVGEVVALDEAPRAEAVAVDSDEALLRSLVVADDSEEAPRLENGGSDEAPYKVVASDSEALLRSEEVADDSGASTLPSSFTWGMAALSGVADMVAVTDTSAEVDAVEAAADEVGLNLEGDGAVEPGEVTDLKGGSELDPMTVDSDLGKDVVREAADDLGLDAGVASDPESGDGTDLDPMTFDSDFGMEVTEDAELVDAGAAEIVVKFEGSPGVDPMPVHLGRGKDASDETAHLGAGVSEGAESDDDSDLDSMPVDSDLWAT